MATKKPAPKKVVKAAPAKAAKPAPKPVKKAAPAKPQSKIVTKSAPVKAAKSATKPVKKEASAKTQPKVVAKSVKKTASAKPQPKVVAKAVVAKSAKPVAKPAKVEAKQKSLKEKVVIEKPAKAEKVVPVKPAKPAKPAKPFKPVKVAVKVSGIEKSTTVIPMKQKPMKKKEEPVKDVKVPKTTIKTSVPYNPSYTSLEKRVETSKPNTPLVKYGDTELNEFRELINKKLEAAKKELAYFQGLITRKDDQGGETEEGRYMTMEDGSLSMEREQLSQMASRTITYIDHLEKAIMRIENKTYGVCRVTGKLIDKARLRAVPHATLSLEAKLGLVKPSGE
jgi:RNA polymerase-binding transcription factor DksA